MSNCKHHHVHVNHRYLNVDNLARRSLLAVLTPDTMAVQRVPAVKDFDLFADSLRAGQRAAAVMSLVQSARMNGHDPYAYLQDVLTRLPTHKASRIEELLPHRWQAVSA